MKRTVIGCYLSTIGALGSVAISIVCACNMVSMWSTPPGRLICTLEELGLTIQFVVSVLIFVVGVIILGKEYFRS